MVQFLLSALNWKDIPWSRHSECWFKPATIICIRTECCFKRACFLCGYLRSVLLRASNRTNGIDGNGQQVPVVSSELETKVVTRYFMAPADCKEGTAPVKNMALHEWLSHVTLLSSPQAWKCHSWCQEELRSCFHKCPNWNCSWFHWNIGPTSDLLLGKCITGKMVVWHGAWFRTRQVDI